MAYAALIDSNSEVLLSLNPHLAAVIFVSKCTTDTLPVNAVEYPNYLRSNFFWKKAFPLAESRPETYTRWRWNFKTRKFSPTPSHLLTQAIREKAAFAHKKVGAISYVMSNISAARHSLRTGIEFQETTHLLQRAEAQEFQRGVNHDPLRFPFLMQYADFAGISPSQAADDLMFQLNLERDILVRSEGTRLKYFDAIKRATTAQQLDAILKEFHTDNFYHGEI